MHRYPDTAAVATPIRYTGTWLQSTPASTASFRLRMLAPSTAGMDSRKENRTANFRSKPTKHPEVMVMPDREMPGTVATAWLTPTATASSSDAVRSFFLPFFTRSLANNRKPVTIRAPPMNSMLLLRPRTLSLMGSTANSGRVPRMISRISRRAGGRGLGVDRWARSPMPRKNSAIMSLMSFQ